MGPVAASRHPALESAIKIAQRMSTNTTNMEGSSREDVELQHSSNCSYTVRTFGMYLAWVTEPMTEISIQHVGTRLISARLTLEPCGNYYLRASRQCGGHFRLSQGPCTISLSLMSM